MCELEGERCARALFELRQRSRAHTGPAMRKRAGSQRSVLPTDDPSGGISKLLEASIGVSPRIHDAKQVACEKHHMLCLFWLLQTHSAMTVRVLVRPNRSTEQF